MMTPSARRTLAAAATAAVVTAVSLWVWHWRDGLPYDSTSGVWVALANDFAHGTLYRPLFDDGAFGGTRYMPLFFVLHGLLMRAGLPVVTVGAALTLASVALLVAAAIAVMRRLDVPRSIAWPAAALMLSSIALQILGLGVRGDVFAAALSTAGFALALRESRGSLALAIICWVLAFATKLTTVFGAAAIIIWLVRRRRLRAAVVVAASLAAGAALVVVLANAASDGRMLASFAATAAGGGTLLYALLSPWWLLRAAAQDPFFLLLLATAALPLARRWQADHGDPVVIWFVVTLLGTLVIFASPGTDSNHLIDLLVIAVITIGTAVSAGAPSHATRTATDTAGTRTFASARSQPSPVTPVTIGLALVFGATLLTWLPGIPSVRHFLERSGRPTWSGLAAMRPHIETPVLSENPLLPILLGHRPDVLDPFNLRILAASRAEVERDFTRRLENGYYRTVILVDWTAPMPAGVQAALEAHTSLGVSQFYGEMNFPDGFLPLLFRHYRLSAVQHPHVLFEYRPD